MYIHILNMHGNFQIGSQFLFALYVFFRFVHSRLIPDSTEVICPFTEPELRHETNYFSLLEDILNILNGVKSVPSLVNWFLFT